MKHNSKVYIVSEYGGEWEDKWEHIVGVCSTLKVANKLKSEILAKREKKTNISLEEYQKMLECLYEYEQDHGTICETEVEGVIKLFPDKNPEDIEAVDKKYFSYDYFTGVDIQKVNFYNE